MTEPQEAPLYERDPEAWNEYLAEGNAKQARKRVGADALLRDPQGRILLVDPKYKPDWDLPGGMVEANEPPVTGLCRELREELQLVLPEPTLKLACVDWVSPHGPWDDSLMFIFDGGVLSANQIDRLKLDHEELGRCSWSAVSDMQGRLRPYVWLRVQAALVAAESEQVAYLHDGTRVSV